MLGRVVDALRVPIDGKDQLSPATTSRVFRIHPTCVEEREKQVWDGLKSISILCVNKIHCIVLIFSFYSERLCCTHDILLLSCMVFQAVYCRIEFLHSVTLLFCTCFFGLIFSFFGLLLLKKIILKILRMR